MEFKKIKGKEHRLYDNMAEFMAFNKMLAVSGDWRRGQEEDWVYTDDLYVCQILRVFYVTVPSSGKRQKCIRTVCGSFVVGQKNVKMLGEPGIAENIYTFSGNYNATYSRAKDRKLNNREFLFARYVASGEDTISAYQKAYPKAVN